MFENTILAFNAGILVSWYAIIPLVLLAIVMEANGSDGWATFWFIPAAFGAYLLFKPSTDYLIIAAIGYFVIGVLWSFYRYKQFLGKKIAYFKRNSKPENLADLISNYTPDREVDRLVAWILIWPVSTIAHLTGDIVLAVRSMVLGMFRGVYRKMYNNALNDAIRRSE